MVTFSHQDITEKLAAHLEERMQWKDSWQLLHDAPKRSSSLGSLQAQNGLLLKEKPLSTMDFSV